MTTLGHHWKHLLGGTAVAALVGALALLPLAPGGAGAEEMAEEAPDVAVVLPAVGGTAFDESKKVKFGDEEFPALAALPPPPIPRDNPQSLDAKGWPRKDDPKVELGKLLFFDARLSGDASVSCATCHDPAEGWGLNSPISRGYPGTSHWRNSHTAVNAAYQGKLFWEGHSLSLEAQAPSAAEGLSGNGKPDMMEQRLRQSPGYVKMFREAFGSPWPAIEDAWRAIAAFERAVLIDPDTPFDRYMRGEEEALDEEQKRGLELFQGKAGCIQCHNGPLLSDEKNYNTGVPLNAAFLKDPVMQFSHRFQLYSRGMPEKLYRAMKGDPGMYLSTHRNDELFKFRTQPLRFLVYTPPYMHNGVFDTLEDVVRFYNEGGGEDQALKYGVATKTKRLKPLGLTDEEIEDLVAFLESTSGEEILMNPPKLPDTEVLVTKEELEKAWKKEGLM